MPDRKYFKNVTDIKAYTSADEAIQAIHDIYNASKAAVPIFAEAVAKKKEDIPNGLRYEGVKYPFVGMRITPSDMNVDARLSYGIAIEHGVYGTTVTRPDIFEDYYKEQIEQLMQHHKCPIYVGVSDLSIPFPFIAEEMMSSTLQEKLWQLDIYDALPNLSQVNDNISNSTHWPLDGKDLPLALFNGKRVDYSLHRLHHYTGTAAKHFQNYVLLTNYQRYINEFIEYAHDQLKNGDEYCAFVEPGNRITHNPRFNGSEPEGIASQNLPQMPAYHLKRPDKSGITFINIGVGPSNAKTITDHVAVLRPHCWLMVGHCAGLRRSQQLGDYILAHGYVREDHVLDQDLPLSVPLPPLAEVQIALQQAVANVTSQHGHDLKSSMRTGTVLTTDNRNWELLSNELFDVFKLTRAIAVDMESATIAANGFRFRVPYGTLLCVSDKPVHGELKLKSSASDFYEKRVRQHFQIGIEAIRLIRETGVLSLHSRKLRGFQEPPFR